MTPERWQRVEKLVQASLGREAHQRVAFLDATCRGDRALREEVESLLDAYEGASSFMENPTFGAELEAITAHRAGPRTEERIGPYTILREIGHGGMSTVFLAARADREYERRVAIKLIRRGTETESLRQRFRRERQILASLDHPNIAKLHDGGTTESGLPYFVMEYLEGTAIDAYCDLHRLTVAERLRLVRCVCSAVQYAHRNLVIHRDIKPANILVTSDGVPKLLDFGIAKLLDPEGFPQTIEATRTALRPMTPSYASPEQVRSGAITTATDVYSLGVLLHKLLVGCLPYRHEARTPQALEDAILRSEPIKPSAVIRRPQDEITAETIAEQRGTSPRHLRRQLEGDLDTIVLMALRKEPHRRYGSVEQLSEDIRRHLVGLPVVAQADTIGYRARKFVRRNKLAVAVVVGFLVLALASSITMAVLTVKIVRERDRARQEQVRTSQVAAFLVDLFEVTETAGNTVSARELLERGAHTARGLDVESEQRAALYNVLGTASLKLGLYDQAMPLLEEALEMRRQILGAQHPVVGESLYHLAEILTLTGEYPRAEALLEEAVEIQRTASGDDNPKLARSLRQLAWLLSVKGEYDEAESLNRKALAMQRRLLGEEHPEVASSLTELAAVLHDKRDLEGAESMYREALALRRRLGEESQELAITLRSLALLLQQKGDLEPAEPLFREALAIGKRVFGDEHPEIASSMNQLAMLLQLKGDSEAAERSCRGALAMRRKLLGDEHPRVGWNLKTLAWLLHRQGELEAAESLYRQSLEILRKGLPEGSLHSASPLTGLGLLLIERGDPRSAEPMLREALALRRGATPGSTQGIARSQIALGECLLALDESEEAEERLVEGYAMLESQSGYRAWDQCEWRLRALRNLVELYQAQNKAEKADEYRSLLGNLPAKGSRAADGADVVGPGAGATP
ncbi:MAG: serine/threonine protein kinase [bacterium]|nr:serine/threonine protein kinase [bacterium]